MEDSSKYTDLKSGSTTEPNGAHTLLNNLQNDINNVKASLGISTLELGNLWYDPYFKHPYCCEADANVPNFDGDFGFITSVGTNDTVTAGRQVRPASDPDGIYPSTMKISRVSTALEYIGLTFSKEFLTSLGFVNGNKFKVSLYIKIPNASAGSTRRVYLYPRGGTAAVEATINSSNWTYLEANLDITVNDDPLQGYVFGVRDGSSFPDYYHITGLMLADTTTLPFPGFKDSFVEQTTPLQTEHNQNIYAKYFTQFCPIIANTNDQNLAVFTSEIIDSTDDPTIPISGVKCAKFTSAPNTLQKLNIVMGQTWSTLAEDMADLELQQIFKNVNVKLGAWVKVEAEAGDTFTVSFVGVSQQTGIKQHAYKLLPVNEWIWVESLLVKFNAADFKRIDSRTPLQIFYNYPKNSVIKVCGVTYSYVDKGIEFQYSEYNKLSEIGNFFQKMWTALGDSITNQFKYILAANKYLGCELINRGIGSTTICNNNTIAWVDSEGNYIDRPPSDPPAGTEGVDYFEIESSMCRQDRINTIPADTKILTIMGGFNDYFSNQPLGTINDAASDALGNTFYAAYKSTLDKALLRCTKAKIMILDITITSLEETANTEGLKPRDYRVALKDIAELYDIPYIVLSDSQIKRDIANYTVDGIHLSTKGAKIIGFLVYIGFIYKINFIDENLL